MAAESSISTAKRDRMIAIIAGVITVTAITLALASGYLGLTWLWLRPAAELLLLAELVGLIVLERHQLFEPVSEKVDSVRTHVEEMHAMMVEAARHSGQVTVCGSTPELFGCGIRAMKEALARDQSGPQILRIGRLSGGMRTYEDPDLLAEFRAMSETIKSFFLTPGSAPMHAPAAGRSGRSLRS